MRELDKRQLKCGDKVLFQLSSWAPSNLHFVEILFVGDEYVVMFNLDRKKEYCVKANDYKVIYGDVDARFYVSEERAE